MNYTITVLPGDGIGTEVTEQAVAVLTDLAKKCGFTFVLSEALMADAPSTPTGKPLPEETLALVQGKRRGFVGSGRGPKWNPLPGNCGPEAGLLGIRAGLGLTQISGPPYLSAFKRLLPSARPSSRRRDILVSESSSAACIFGARGRKTLEGWH
jgi:3-isopropylmalate dehydrogenase